MLIYEMERMNNQRSKLVYLVLMALAIPLLSVILFYFYLIPSVENAFIGRYNSEIKFIIDVFYPRFYVEKERFELAFFISKVYQVLIRFIMAYFIAVGVILFYNYFRTAKSYFEKITTQVTTYKNVSILRVILYSFLFYTAIELLTELIAMQPLVAFYKPIIWLKVIGIPFPNRNFVYLIGTLWLVSIIAVIVNYRAVLCSFISIILFVLVQSWIYSFEKFDHGYVTLTFVLMLMPFLLEESNKKKVIFSSWSLVLIQICIAMPYTLSGLEKLFISGMSWLNPGNIITYLKFHETSISKIIIQYPVLCMLISLFTLLLQLSFILILFFPRYKWVWLIGGVLFHTGTLLVMEIGHPFNPWIVVYVCFVDWTNVYDYCLKKLDFLRGSTSRSM